MQRRYIVEVKSTSISPTYAIVYDRSAPDRSCPILSLSHAKLVCELLLRNGDMLSEDCEYLMEEVSRAGGSKLCAKTGLCPGMRRGWRGGWQESGRPVRFGRRTTCAGCVRRWRGNVLRAGSRKNHTAFH